MVPFIHADFLLDGTWAKRLYHEVAAPLPIIDYHCHLSPELIADNHQFRSLTELWLDGDHYKWRAMRAAGVDERYITGDASDFEKFGAWARVVPKTLRNPLYHWTHLELRRPFGIDGVLLDERSAARIYGECNERLKHESFFARGLVEAFSVRVVCTTDDPTDDLAAHTRHARVGSTVKLLPTFRPDAALGVDRPATYGEWIRRLEERSGVAVRDVASLLEALDIRHVAFHDLGCRLSDHGLDQMYAEDSPAEAERAFSKALSGKLCDAKEAVAFKSLVLLELARMDHRRGWTQQFHLGALRDTNSRRLTELGPNTGYDSIDDQPMARPLARFLDRLEATGQLAKTILYNLNPRDNEVFATMAGNFQSGPIPGKIQFGSAWWFLDQLDGMEKQINALSTLGLLSTFVGMLTDSRSFVSYSRHEYFRRLLCNIIGRDVERGLLPADAGLLSGLVRDVCYENAERYFDFD